MPGPRRPHSPAPARQLEVAAEIEHRVHTYRWEYPSGTVATVRDRDGDVRWRVMECFIRKDGVETWCWTPCFDDPDIPKRVSAGSVLEIFYRPDSNDPDHIHFL